MKKYLIYLILVFTVTIGFTPTLQADKTTDTRTASISGTNADYSAKANLSGNVQVKIEPEQVSAFDTGVILENWGILSLGLLSFLEIIVRLTPSEKDNSILTIVSKILNALIPNLRKGGGKF